VWAENRSTSARKGRDWTLQTKTNVMLERRINDLRSETGYGLDKVPILSNTERWAWRELDELLELKARQKRAEAMALQQSTEPTPAPSDAPTANCQPVEGSKKERARKKRNGPLIPQEEELQRFFKVIESVRDRAIFRLMYHGGLRASEIGLLELRDYSLRTDRIMVNRLKGSNTGEHHLCREESRALRAWLKVRGAAPGPIFKTARGPISRSMLDVLVKKYGANAGWPRRLCHCHVFKHACCTTLLTKGFNVEQVQDWVGHANIQNTMIYARITNARRDEMAGRLKNWC
jgi:integrase